VSLFPLFFLNFLFLKQQFMRIKMYIYYLKMRQCCYIAGSTPVTPARWTRLDLAPAGGHRLRLCTTPLLMSDHYPWPWLGSHLAALRYVMHFRFMDCVIFAHTGTHVPYGITQCYLPPGRVDVLALTPAEAGTRLSDPGGIQG